MGEMPCRSFSHSKRVLRRSRLRRCASLSGALFLGHGLVKLIGFPAGAQPGAQPLLSLFGVGGIIEGVTGLLLIAGLFTRPAAFIASGQMAVAYWMFHFPASFYPAVNGGDTAILFSFVFLHIAAAGAGAFSLDALFRREDEPHVNLRALALRLRKPLRV
jgi:putative oxidoreductase